MVFKFHGNIQIFLNIFELVLEVFMNSSKKFEQFMNSSKVGPPPEPLGVLFFASRQPQFFFSDFKNTMTQRS